MSCLTQEERLALEDIFLSIGANQSPLLRWQMICKSCSKSIGLKTVAMIHSRRNLKTYATAKLFVRNKRQVLSKHFGVNHSSHRG